MQEASNNKIYEVRKIFCDAGKDLDEYIRATGNPRIIPDIY